LTSKKSFHKLNKAFSWPVAIQWTRYQKHGEALKALRPAIFIPTLYFASGLPYTLVVLVSVIFYKNLGESNDFVGKVTSCFYLAWVAKFLWAPLVDLVGQKKIWIVIVQVILAATSAFLALSLGSSQIALVSIIVFSCMALVSATQDVSSDGYYLEVLNKEQQSYFVGVRNAFYKMAVLFGQGGLVMLAGWLAHYQAFGVKGGWVVAFLICAAIFAMLAIFHFFALPGQPESCAETIGAEDASTLKATTVNFSQFLTVFRTFFAQKAIVPIVAYILIFRLGDALMLKMSAPFLLDPIKAGGLGISTETVGLIYGGVGVAFLLLGGIVGGFVVSKFGLKKSLMPTAIFQNGAILLYYYMAISAPNVLLVSICNAIEQFAYGLGTAAYTVFLLRTVNPLYKSGHYAIATALMAAGVMIPGYFSGQLQASLGYPHFFLLSFVLSIPGMITILLLPLEEK